MKKELLSSLLWGVVLFVVQVALDLVKKEPIDWQTTIMASVMLIVIHFFVSRGRTSIENTGNAKKNGVTENGEIKQDNQAAAPAKSSSIANKAKGKIDSAPKTADTSTAMGQRGYSVEDLRFYTFHRNAMICVLAGLVALVIWYLKSHAWLLYGGIGFFVVAVIFYLLYLKTRNDFIEKQRKEKGLK